MNYHLKLFFPYCIITFTTVVVFFQNLGFDYSYLDDNLIVFQEYQKINSISKVPYAFTGGYLYDTYYRPIVMTSFIIDTAIAGQSSTMYHLTNLILHVLVCFLVYSLLKELTRKDILSLILTLFFCIHPINLNSVSWIAGRNDLLLTFFTLSSFLSFIKYVNNKKKTFLILSSLFCLLGMFSKETAILTPVLIMFYLGLINGFKIKPRMNQMLVVIMTYTIPALIYFMFRFILSHVNEPGSIGLSAFFTNLNIPFEYLSKIFYLPAILPLSMPNNDLMLGGIFLFVIILTIIILKRNVEKKIVYLGLTIFLLFVLPPLFVHIPADDGGFNYIDCRFYLPFFGLLLIFAAIVKSFWPLAIWKNLNIKVGTTILISIFFVYVLFSNLSQNQNYSNGKLFWGSVLMAYPERATYWIGLGYYYFDKHVFS